LLLWGFFSDLPVILKEKIMGIAGEIKMENAPIIFWEIQTRLPTGIIIQLGISRSLP